LSKIKFNLEIFLSYSILNPETNNYLKRELMETQDFIKFIENLSVVKDVEKKSELIKSELNKLNKLIRENDDSSYSSRMEKLERKNEYNEILSYKNVLSFRLSILQANNDLK